MAQRSRQIVHQVTKSEHQRGGGGAFSLQSKPAHWEMGDATVAHGIDEHLQRVLVTIINSNNINNQNKLSRK